MDLLEYMGKQVFEKYGIPVSDGRICVTSDEVEQAAKEIGGTVVVKAQVQVGGRGKAGGIQLADSPQEARNHADKILGMDIKGHVVERVWVESATDISQEYYASITLDRSAGLPLFMVSAEGGVEIEDVAENNPDALVRMHVDPLVGFRKFHAINLTRALPPEAREQAADVFEKLWNCFLGADAELVEINPLVLTTDGRVHALDAKVSIDDNALYKHPHLEAWRDILTTDPQERKAKEKKVAYVKLDGEVGIMGNGAGLVMATLDLVQQAGGSAANFLDVGGGASGEQIAAGLEIVLSDPKVRSVLINIFGGIVRCDVVAEGIIDALDRVKLNVPMVVRLDGTNAELGRKILAEAALDGVTTAPTMTQAAALAVEKSRG